MFNFLKDQNTIGRKRLALDRLIQQSIASVESIQSATDKLVTINDSINKTTREIEDIEASFSLIKNELGQRKDSNTAIINQIKTIGEKNGKAE